MGQKLYNAALGPKELILYASNVHHNAVDVFKEPNYVAKLKQFVEQSLAAA